ncbi:MAG: sensor histidine kinase [Merdibacter sp.]
MPACIEAFDVNAIFQRFYKGDAARNTKGSGLGMAIVKELCEQMDIEVQAEKIEEQLMITLRIPMSAHSRTTSSMEAL